MRKNYVLIDYENVQPESLDALNHDPFHVVVFVGANQTKVAYEVASALQRMGERAAYIKIAGNGSNALDFHIAFHIGQLSVQEPDACFHIVSKDTGFDPLIQHLKGKKIAADRITVISDIPLLKAPPPKARISTDRVATVVTNLIQRGASKPRTLKTLSSTINALFQKSLNDDEIKQIIAALTKKGVITVNEFKVSYSLPAQNCEGVLEQTGK